MRKKLNIGILRRYIGALLLLESVFMIVPMITCVIFGESEWLMFLITALITASCGYIMASRRTQSDVIGKREGFLLTASVWVFFSLFGMLPFMMCSLRLDFCSAFFEAMSAFTTTGATTIDTSQHMLSHGMLMWQALMQWLGGMGIILFTLAIIPTLNTSGGMQMFNAETTGIIHEKIMPRISQTAMVLWGMYLILTVILIVLLLLGGLNMFDSICHAFGTISTGGFSSRAASLAEFHSDYMLVVITIFMFLGGTSFALLYKLLLGKWRQIGHGEVFKIYIGTILVATVMFSLTHVVNGEAHSLRDVVLLPLFQVVSTISSTGYMAPGFSILNPFILLLTFILMFSGGCAGSTSGGAKIDRLVYLKRFVGGELRRAVHPRVVPSVRVDGRVVAPDLVSKVIAFLCLYGLCIIGGSMLLSMMGLPPVDSLFSAFSSISNTGFGASVTGYGDDFLTIPHAAKWVLAALMLTGRLEIYTILVLFVPEFWRR